MTRGPFMIRLAETTDMRLRGRKPVLDLHLSRAESISLNLSCDHHLSSLYHICSLARILLGSD